MNIFEFFLYKNRTSANWSHNDKNNDADVEFIVLDTTNLTLFSIEKYQCLSYYNDKIANFSSKLPFLNDLNDSSAILAFKYSSISKD